MNKVTHLEKKKKGEQGGRIQAERSVSLANDQQNPTRFFSNSLIPSPEFIRYRNSKHPPAASDLHPLLTTSGGCCQVTEAHPYTAQETFQALWILSASVITVPNGLWERYCSVRSSPAVQKPPLWAPKTPVLLGAVSSHF